MVHEEERDEAERVLENCLAKQFRNIMYQARVDAVKKYYDQFLNNPIRDEVARKKELREAQYVKAKLDWIDTAPWASLCSYWCSAEFKKKRKLGQESRLKSDDIAQNRGGSRSFTQTQKFMVSMLNITVALVCVQHLIKCTYYNYCVN